MSQKENISNLKKRLKTLEDEYAELQKAQTFSLVGDTVMVPKKFKSLFDQAQKTVGEYFSHLKMDPTHGSIEINEQRYVLVRASALAHDFLTTIQEMYADRGEVEALNIGKNFLFDIAHLIGKNDAVNFHSKMNLQDPIAKLAAGPVHFAYSGWAFVDILPQSKPSPDENFYLIYRHPYSFEADSWLQAGKKSKTPVCSMNAGYSSGWSEESFGIPLTAVEVTCRAKGDEHCTFIMSPPHKIEKHLERFTKKVSKEHDKKATYDIPTYFERKKIEEQLALYALIVESSDDAIYSVSMDDEILSWNRGAQKVFGYTEKEVVGKKRSILIPEDRREEELELQARIKSGEAIRQFETQRLHKKGNLIEISITVSPVTDSKGNIIAASVIGHDISKRKRAENALKDLNNSLEKLVQERTSDLQRAYDELETRVTFRNLELEKTNKANLAKIEELEKQLASLQAKK
ncbi:PAS domain S-box protein [Adhaeribacter terreus]|uniref:histidine kinase n=1 Tax=Adhaeribacter terreus TaxID=529703 RepID=A0ABW0EAV7_9BACT